MGETYEEIDGKIHVVNKKEIDKDTFISQTKSRIRLYGEQVDREEKQLQNTKKLLKSEEDKLSEFE